ncbi:hypothetical protein VdG2_05851 [Verticillium dahliae VDG2]|nr:hypothetical protein VdG2_05851 [Verticillium dahliae VDG2]
MEDQPMINAADESHHDEDDRCFSFKAVRAAVDDIFASIRTRRQRRKENRAARRNDHHKLHDLTSDDQPSSIDEFISQPAPALPRHGAGISLPRFVNNTRAEPSWLELWAANNEAWSRSREMCRVPDEIVNMITEYFVRSQPSVKYVTVRGVYHCACQDQYRQVKTWTGDGQPAYGDHCWCHIRNLNLLTLGSTLRRDMRLPEDDIVRAAAVGVPPSYVIEQVSSKFAPYNRSVNEKPLFGQAWTANIRDNEDAQGHFFRYGLFPPRNLVPRHRRLPRARRSRDINERSETARVDINRPGDNVGLYKEEDLFMIKYPYIEPAYPWLNDPYRVWQLDSSFHYIKRAAMDLTEFRRLGHGEDMKMLFRNMDRNERWPHFHARGMHVSGLPMGGPASVMYDLPDGDPMGIRTVQEAPNPGVDNDMIEVEVLNVRQGLDPARGLCLTPPIHYWSWALPQAEMDENEDLLENLLMVFQQDLDFRDIDLDMVPQDVIDMVQNRIRLHLEQASIEGLEEHRELYRPWADNRPNGATQFLADVLSGCDDFFLVTPLTWHPDVEEADLTRYLRSMQHVDEGPCTECGSRHDTYPQRFHATRDMDYVEVRLCSGLELWDMDELQRLDRDRQAIFDAWPVVTHSLQPFRRPPSVRFLTLFPRDSRVWSKFWNLPCEDGGHELGTVGKYTPGRKRAFRDTYTGNADDEEPAGDAQLEVPLEETDSSEGSPAQGAFASMRKRIKTRATAGHLATKGFLQSMETNFRNGLASVRLQGTRPATQRRPLSGSDFDGIASTRQQLNQGDAAAAIPPQLPVFPGGPPDNLQPPYAPITQTQTVRHMLNPGVNILGLNTEMAFGLNNQVQAHVYAQIAALGYEVPNSETPNPVPPGPASQFIAGGTTAHTVLVRQRWNPAPSEFRQYVWEILTQENDHLLSLHYPAYHTHWPYPEPPPGPWPFSRDLTPEQVAQHVPRGPPTPWPPADMPPGPPLGPPPPPPPPPGGGGHGGGQDPPPPPAPPGSGQSLPPPSTAPAHPPASNVPVPPLYPVLPTVPGPLGSIQGLLPQPAPPTNPPTSQAPPAPPAYPALPVVPGIGPVLPPGGVGASAALGGQGPPPPTFPAAPGGSALNGLDLTQIPSLDRRHAQFVADILNAHARPGASHYVLRNTADGLPLVLVPAPANPTTGGGDPHGPEGSGS